MDPHLAHSLYEALHHVQGFIYPNEVELHWSIMIVLYPFITGLVAGAFILASLERVFNVKEVEPTYRLSLLTALSFMLCATFPLMAHLGHPERAYEMLVHPNLQSAMAVFGFVYAWYLMGVLLLEIWFDFRPDIIEWSKTAKGLKRLIYKFLLLGINEISPATRRLDNKVGRAITIIGIPSAFLLHGYVGFIFGSVKANPWWSSTLVPVIFIFSAMVSGIAMVMLLYMVLSYIRKVKIDMICVDRIASFLLYVFILDFTLEMLDLIHRIYEAEESIDILSLLMGRQLFFSQFIVQILLGTLVPITLLALIKFIKFKERTRRVFYLVSSVFAIISIFAMRWNVVIGGQLFSKSFLGFTSYKLQLIGIEGVLMACVLLILPFIILTGLLWLLPPWGKPVQPH